MLTIKSEDTASQRATNYSLVLGSLFFASSFFQINRAVALVGFLIIEAALLIIVFSERRVQTLKIQGKRLDILYGGSSSKSWQTYQLADLNGEVLKFNRVVGSPYYVLKIFRENQLIGLADTRKGFEKSRLETLLSLMKRRGA
ncbi:hypothetical protein GKZ68_08745 [Hymenobacter sp. BRD128]|uniref:hypothetical protein n=1 Tax=Hymenobacter sp. BRD128 TaxID=2675878 RepID=UPI0015670684|nr:hypothetical protein [Hymenobacter sp. BRD128]QKG56701.1 hypothetical protein GKZ68_08745 [Hymenobacter sp. BRD128]